MIGQTERDDEWLNPGAAGNDDVDTMPPTSTLDIHFWPAAKRCRPMVIFGILLTRPVSFCNSCNCNFKSRSFYSLWYQVQNSKNLAQSLQFFILLELLYTGSLLEAVKWSPEAMHFALVPPRRRSMRRV